jgi:spore germination protein GerM
VTARPVLAVVALTLLVAACDPGAQAQPEAIPTRDVPFQLLDTTSTTVEASPASIELPFTIDLASGDQLVEANRSAVDAADPTVVLRALLEGPTTDEARLGIVSAIPTGTRLRKVERDGPVLTIDLTRDFRGSGADSMIAVAQLVWTATRLPEVASVRIRVAGAPVQVPTGSGALAAGPVTRADFPQLA